MKRKYSTRKRLGGEMWRRTAKDGAGMQKFHSKSERQLKEMKRKGYTRKGEMWRRTARDGVGMQKFHSITC